jgi:aspartyl protease family protein
MAKRILFAGLMLIATFIGHAMAAPEVIVRGLFNNKAMLTINGQNQLLKAGQRSAEGVLLVSSNSRQAVVEIEGVRRTLKLTQEIAGSYTAALQEEIRIPRSPDSHYRVGGSINGHPVTMLIDTGATLVVMNLNDARRLGVDYRNGEKSLSATAGGVVDSYVVNLRTINVGNIELAGVKAAVVMGDFPVQILLGNSFLSRVSLKDEAGVLVMRTRF